MKTIMRAATLAALVPAAVLAQGPGHHRFGPPGPPPGFGGPGGPRFAEEGMKGRHEVVKGAPFKAQSIDEHVQVLGDGNRIVHRMSATLWRDGEGRTRREMEGRVVLDDPVAGTGYVLDSETRTAMQRPAPPGPPGERPQRVPEGRGPRMEMEEPGERRTESLGTRTIEGFEATGTRTTLTIAAGAIGNDKPIQVVSERWYAPELQAVVLGTHRDPRFGESTHRLTSISRGEPDRSLFEVPADYTVRQGRPPMSDGRPGPRPEQP